MVEERQNFFKVVVHAQELEISSEMHVKMTQIDCPIRRAEGKAKKASLLASLIG